MYVENDLASTDLFDYIKINEADFSDISRLSFFNDLLSVRESQKPLVIDVRITESLFFDFHTRSFMDYLASMFIEEDIPNSSLVSREHFGWDEFNSWWLYEQRWKIKNPDMSASSGMIEPFGVHEYELRPYLPDFDFEAFRPVTRPLIFLTNTAFRSYFKL